MCVEVTPGIGGIEVREVELSGGAPFLLAQSADESAAQGSVEHGCMKTSVGDATLVQM